jgi:hypothetical protein
MATFSAFLDTLPDPNNPIGDDGRPVGTDGPGFKSIKFTSQAPVQVSRTNSGRVITRQIAGHKWSVNITYNPMTRTQFEPVFSFLLQQKGRLNPFYVQLPNQYTARDSVFATHVASNTITNEFALTRGVNYMVQEGHHASNSPKPGDMFTITNSKDSLHTKAYRVTRVMTTGLYWAGLTGNDIPTDTEERGIYFTPNLQRDVGVTDVNGTDVGDGIMVYHQPKIRVILNKDIQEYSLGTNNLYTFSLSLEEAQA